MRLSDAVALGLPEIKFTRYSWLSKRGDVYEGCLVGAALWSTGMRDLLEDFGDERDPMVSIMAKRWPWTMNWKNDRNQTVHGFLTRLAAAYDEKTMTFEQVVAAVRAIEPAELTEKTPQLVESASPSLEVRK